MNDGDMEQAAPDHVLEDVMGQLQADPELARRRPRIKPAGFLNRAKHLQLVIGMLIQNCHSTGKFEYRFTWYRARFYAWCNK